MKPPRNQKELWVGVAEVRPKDKDNEILKGRKGAFVNFVTWASSSEEFAFNIELVARKFGLFVSEIVNPEPVDLRRRRVERFKDETEDMISRAQEDPNAIIYGTFHTFEKDDA